MEMTTELLQSILPLNINLMTIVDADCIERSVMIPHADFRKMLITLCSHTARGMKHGGTLSISLDNGRYAPVEHSTASAGRHLRLAVLGREKKGRSRATGSDIASQFTSKGYPYRDKADPAIAGKIANRHNGHLINIDSDGESSGAEVYLPTA